MRTYNFKNSNLIVTNEFTSVEVLSVEADSLKEAVELFKSIIIVKGFKIVNSDVIEYWN